MNDEEIDFMTVYLDGRYDERKTWQKLIDVKIEKLENSIKWNNYDEVMYAIKVLKDLKKGE